MKYLNPIVALASVVALGAACTPAGLKTTGTGAGLTASLTVSSQGSGLHGSGSANASFSGPGSVIETLQNTADYSRINAISCDALGNTWALTRNHNLVRYNLAGSVATVSAGVSPIGLGVDSSNNVWVLDGDTTGSFFPFGGYRAQIIGPGAITPGASSSLMTISPSGSSATFSVGVDPKFLAVDKKNGAAWVAAWEDKSWGNGTGSVSVVSGGTAHTYSNPGINRPKSLGVDAGDNAWVVNQDGTLAKVTPTGAVATQSSTTNSYWSVYPDARGNVWIQGNTGLDVIPVGGSSIATVSTNTSMDFQTVDPTGHLWACDYHTWWVYRFNPDGTPAATWSVYDTESITLDPSGNAWIVSDPTGQSGYDCPNCNYYQLQSLKPRATKAYRPQTLLGVASNLPVLTRISPTGTVATSSLTFGVGGNDPNFNLTTAFDAQGNLWLGTYNGSVAVLSH